MGLIGAIVNALKQLWCPNVIIRALGCLEKLLQHGEVIRGQAQVPVNPFILAFEAENGQIALEALQEHSNQDIYLLASKLLNIYFCYKVSRFEFLSRIKF